MPQRAIVLSCCTETEKVLCCPRNRLAEDFNLGETINKVSNIFQDDLQAMVALLTLRSPLVVWKVTDII